jgi:hypothetical protein
VKEIIEELEEIAYQAGDTLDREGNYISDNIRTVIKRLKAMTGAPI